MRWVLWSVKIFMWVYSTYFPLYKSCKYHDESITCFLGCNLSCQGKTFLAARRYLHTMPLTNFSLYYLIWSTIVDGNTFLCTRPFGNVSILSLRGALLSWLQVIHVHHSTYKVIYLYFGLGGCNCRGCNNTHVPLHHFGSFSLILWTTSSFHMCFWWSYLVSLVDRSIYDNPWKVPWIFLHRIVEGK